ncbi:hypothetical protein GCM10009730_17650 [Streptomyces albidochromogenes]
MSTASYGPYLWTGIPDGFCSCVALVIGVGRPTGAFIAWGSSVSCKGDGRRCRCSTRLRGEGVGLELQTLAAAAKEKQPVTHDVPQPSRVGPVSPDPYQYAGPPRG